MTDQCKMLAAYVDATWWEVYKRRALLFQTQTQQTVTIPKEHHRFILGKGGERLQRLESETATKISLPKANEDGNEITITGPRDGIEMAIHKINEVSFEQGSKVNFFLHFMTTNAPRLCFTNSRICRKKLYKIVMLFPLKLKLILREIALFYTNFSTNSRICEAKSRGISILISSR